MPRDEEDAEEAPGSNGCLVVVLRSILLRSANISPGRAFDMKLEKSSEGIVYETERGYCLSKPPHPSEGLKS